MGTVESPVSIQSRGIELAGSFVRPAGDAPPAALLINGSGPLDRDGNFGKQKLNVSGQLAEVLAEAGWASLRVDKRGVGESGGDYQSTGFREELDDVGAAAKWLIGRRDIGVVVAIGHSVGATYAAELSAFQPGLSGAVLVAYTAKTGRDTLVWQAGEIGETIPGWVQGVMKVFRTSVTKQQAKALEKLASTTDDVVRIQGQKVNAKWMREFMAYDPLPTLSVTKTPILAITGAKDVQVDPADIEVVAETLGGRGQVHVLDDLDHILRNEPADTSNVRKYKDQAVKPIDQRVIDLITDWLGRTT